MSTSRNLPPVSADTSAFLPRKPRISQTLLDLLSSHGQCRDNGINASKTGSVKNVLAGNTPPFLPESIKQQFKTLQDAPVKKEGTYKITPFHLPAKPQIQPPCTPLKPDYDNHNGLGCASDDRDGAAIQTNRGNYGQKPTYAMVASNFGLSPDVVEKTVKVETLFTPVRMPEVKQTQPFEIDPSDTSRDRSFNTTTDCSQSGEVVNTTKSDTVGYSPLLEMAEELGVSAETIKAIIKRLGALI